MISVSACKKTVISHSDWIVLTGSVLPRFFLTLFAGSHLFSLFLPLHHVSTLRFFLPSRNVSRRNWLPCPVVPC